MRSDRHVDTKSRAAHSYGRIPDRGGEMKRFALALVLLAACTMPAAALASGFATYQPTTVDPRVSTPPTKHCTVTILPQHGFAGFDPVRSSYDPPSRCPGPWSKIVLDATTHVRGVQYDRIGMLWLGRDELLRFSTAEPTAAGIHYDIEKDVTAYAPLMRSPEPVTTLLGNVVNKEYTGVISMSATLTFYEASAAFPAANVPDVIVAIDGSKPGTPSADGALSKTVDGLPTNIRS